MHIWFRLTVTVALFLCVSLLSIINVNCQSISNKKGDMLDFIETYNPDIICGTETWLTKEHKDGELCIGFLDQYDLFIRDRCDRLGGRALIVAKKDLQAQLQTQLEARIFGYQ